MMRSLLLKLSVGAGLFVQGLLFGWLFILLSNGTQLANQSGQDTAFPKSHTADVPPIPDTKGPLIDPQQSRQMGEQYLRQGNPFQALPHLLSAASDNLKTADPDLVFRIALCYEAAEDWPTAQALYQNLLERTPDAPLALASKLGLSRVLIRRQKFRRAQELLWPHFMSMDKQRNVPLHQDVIFHLAQAVHQPVFRQNALWGDDRPMVVIASDVQPQVQLQNLTSARQEESAGQLADALPEKLRIENAFQSGDDPRDLVFDIQSKACDLILALRLISETLQVPISITDAAVAAVQGKMLSFQFSGVELAMLLDAITSTQGLSWQSDQGTIYILAKGELNEAQSRAVTNQTAERLVRRSLMIAPGHRQTDLMQLMLGVVVFDSGKVAEATAIFEEITEKNIAARFRQAAYFNLGTIYQRSGDAQRAGEALNHVVESHAPVSLQSAALYQLGLLGLNDGILAQCTDAFTRVIRITSDPELKQAAVLGLAIADVLADRPGLARSNIYRYRGIFKGTRLQTVAMAIGQIADWQVRKEKTTDIEKTELLASVATVQWPPNYQVFGRYLGANVYREMGMLSAANEELSRVVEFANHRWIHRKVAAQLGQNLLAINHTDEARQVIQTVLLDQQRAEDVPLWISLAQLEYQQSNLDQAAAHCRTILDLSTDDDLKSVALKLLGQIYQQRGLHHHAALCFSGVLPSPSQ